MEKFHIIKDSRNKSLTRYLLETFTQIIIYTYLLLATSLIIFSLPLAIPELLGYFSNNRQIEPSIIYGYIIFVLVTVFLDLAMIKKHGAENFWKIMLRYNVFYRGKSGKYYKWLVIFIILFILISLLVAYLQYLLEK